jgi:RND family efflux transporter MFP subunit
LKKTVLVLIGVAVLAVIGWRTFQAVQSRQSNGTRRGATAPTVVELSPVRKMEIRDGGDFTGTLHPQSKFVVAPKIGGRLDKLWVNIGDHVRADQPIAELENDEYRRQVDQAQAELQVARANLAESRSALDITGRELARVKALRVKKIASESELDAARAQFTAQEAKQKVSLAQVDQKLAALKAAQVRLDYARISLPAEKKHVQWVVGERFVDEGAMLAANTPIVSVLDIGTLTAVIYVIEKDYPKIQVNQPAAVRTDAFPQRTFHGNIARIAPELKESSRQARVEVQIDNADQTLKPGMFVRVRIDFAVHTDAVVIPRGAVVLRDGRQGVFVVEPEARTARFVPIRPGIIQGDLAEVLDPPLNGEIVSLGQHLLEDGGAVVISGRPAPNGPASGKSNPKTKPAP